MARRKINKVALASHRCPYCDSKIDEPLGTGPSSKEMVKLGKELGLKFSDSNLKHFVKIGMLPRPVKKHMVLADGKHSSIGVYPERAGARLRIIAKMRAVHHMSEREMIEKFKSKGLLYE